MKTISLQRTLAIMIKEFIQMRRDPTTLSMIIGIPLVQLILFGFAINMDPKHLPIAIVNGDHSPMTRTLINSMENSHYFRVTGEISPDEADNQLKKGKIQFALRIPPGFTHDLVRGDRPLLLLEADATDPAATGNAVAAVEVLAREGLNRDLKGPLQTLQATPGPINFQLHARYNPLRKTQYNIVPGLLGVVLTMTMVMITALAITKEHERGTMENLLATPARPLEVMLGKISPYVIVGYIQAILILAAAQILFNVPGQGSIILLLILCLPFIAATLAMGLFFSTVSRNQLQAIQASMFFFLPSILLSGFMFPFRGMPDWAQWIGNMLPLTYFLKIVRGILLKGNTFFDLLNNIWPMLLFLLVVLTVALKKFKQTLD